MFHFNVFTLLDVNKFFNDSEDGISETDATLDIEQDFSARLTLDQLYSESSQGMHGVRSSNVKKRCIFLSCSCERFSS